MNQSAAAAEILLPEGFEVFEGSSVNSFTLIGDVAEGEPEKVREQMKKYVEILSWGSQKG